MPWSYSAACVTRVLARSVLRRTGRRRSVPRCLAAVLFSIVGMSLTFVSAPGCATRQCKAPTIQGGTLVAVSAPLDIQALLSQVSDGASWQDLSPGLREEFERHAADLLRKDRMSWGRPGLAEKERILAEQPTQAMRDNIDRVLSVEYASLLPNGFALERDVKNPALRRLLIRLYLVSADRRQYLLFDHPDFRAWDGNPIREFHLLDHQHVATMAAYTSDLETQLRMIPDAELDETEKALRAKSYFITRAGKHFHRPPVGISGSFAFATTYAWPPERRPYAEDKALLDAYNASMFAEFQEVNRGTLESFVLDYDKEFNETWLKNQGMAPDLIKAVLKLGNLYRTRVLAHPDRDKRCTLYSAEDRSDNWDAFTASQLANADGSETMEGYAASYAALAQQRLAGMQDLARSTLDRLFPLNSSDLGEAQRATVLAQVSAATRPAGMLETLYAALDSATGTTTASDKLRAAVRDQTMVGGYATGEILRPDDQATVLEMWEKVRAYIQREYSGYLVDIASLLPRTPTITTTGDTCFASAGVVSIGLKNAWNKASLYSMVLHEAKHAIDQNSHAPVEGAAREGAATSIERQVWPLFIEEAMASEAAKLPLARLITEIDNVRFTATTDATLKIFLRDSCAPDQPDTIDYAKQVVAGYGYTDPAVLALRSKRAHASTQYLEYDYGLAIYAGLLNYLQAGVGESPRVDAYLLQACGMPSPAKDHAAIDRLTACVHARRYDGR
jgi:hypothetical protein